MSSSDRIVLVIDDEPRIRRFLRAALELHGGFSVIEGTDASEGLKMLASTTPDIVVLDLGLPDLHGSEVLSRIRLTSDIPVIVLSAVAEPDEKVRLLNMGADDYIVKPFPVPEFLARIEAALRRYYKSATQRSTVTIGPLTLDLAGHVVVLDGTEIPCTRNQYRLLQALATNAGRVVSYDELLGEVWTDSSQKNLRNLRLLVGQLREKFDTDPKRPLFITHPGVGYRLQVDPGSPAEGTGAAT